MLFPCVEGSGGQGDRDGTIAGCRRRAAAMAYRLLIEIRATDARGEVVLHIEASLQLDAQAEPQHGSKAAGRCPALVGPERHFRIEPCGDGGAAFAREGVEIGLVDRKSTRLNSSH